MEETRYFRRGLGNRDRVTGILRSDYDSGLVEYLRLHGHRLRYQETEIRLAREFGFCYGVDRAVEYAYETRDRFPNRRIWITGEIIHNPGVNRRLEEMGVRFLPPPGSAGDRLAEVDREDVVLIPAFGIDHEEFSRLRDGGVILVDTTCGSVLTVWKSVEKYARSGITSVIHGKVDHEETQATCSQVRKHPGAHYVVLRDKHQAALVCGFIEGKIPARELTEALSDSCSDRFDPHRHLERIGLANQTTMLSSESLEIAGMLRESMARRWGSDQLGERFHSFDTICSATQERQDAVLELIREGIDMAIVIGGFNSSNTNHLLEISSRSARSYHIEDADNLVSARWIRHKPLGSSAPIMEEEWLPGGALTIGVTAGASTPNSQIGRSVARLLTFRGVPPEELERVAAEGARLEEERRRSLRKNGSPAS